MPEIEQGHELIDAVHRAALDPADWQGLGAAIERMAGGNPVALYGADDATGLTTLTWAGGFDPGFVQSYLDHYIALSPWTGIFPLLAKGRTHLLAAELPSDVWKGEFYNDWLRPQGNLGGGAGVRTRAVGTRSILVGVNIRARDRERFEVPTRRMLGWLEPHLAHALAVNEMVAAIAGRALAAEAGEKGADGASRGGVVVVDCRGLICWLDSGAAGMFGDLLGMTPIGRLAFRPPEAQAWFEAIQATGGRDNRAPKAPLPMARAACSGRAWIIRALHLPADPPATPAFPGYYLGRASGRGLALVMTRGRPETSGAARLRDQHGLTGAEVAVARALVEGLSTSEIVDLRQTSLNTVRNQIQSLLFKLGARNRAEAISLLLRAGGQRPLD